MSVQRFGGSLRDWPGGRHVSWPEAAPFGPGIDALLPSPGERGEDLILCLHGFPATPALFRLVRASAAARGYEVAAPLLPGCGTRPEDIVRVRYRDWVDFAIERWRHLRPRYRRGWIVGSSVGGSLALELAAAFARDGDLAPSGVATIGSPVVLNALLRRGMLAHPLLYVAGALRFFVPSLNAALPDPERDGEDGDERWRGYHGRYPGFSATLQTGLRRLERRLREIRAPLVILHERSDRMVDSRNAGIIAELSGGDAETLYYEMGEAGHMRHDLLLYDSTRDEAWSAILDRFDRFREASRA